MSADVIQGDGSGGGCLLLKLGGIAFAAGVEPQSQSWFYFSSDAAANEKESNSRTNYIFCRLARQRGSNATL
jgi:hypothetical protein